LNFALFLDDVLAKNKANRRGASEECKRGDVPGRRRCNKHLDERDDRRDMQYNRRLGYQHAYMRGSAERAVGVRDVPLRVDVNSLNRAAGDDQGDAQQREEKPPRTLHLRS
jgi:hypothetical protein